MLKGIGTPFRQVTPLTISANTTSYNLFTAAGSPVAPALVVCTVASGVTVGTLSTGTFPAGSVLKLVNLGKIVGGGGYGGHGGSSSGRGQHTAPGAGGDGGDAIVLGHDLEFDNGSGYIFAGGGGGGGAAALYVFSSEGGGGGGGGSGYPGGAAGTKGIGFDADGTDGGPGEITNGGGGGWSGPAGAHPTWRGGDGGTWSAGSPGTDQMLPPESGAGGAMGRAVALNGHALTWASGHNESQVKGTIG